MFTIAGNFKSHKPHCLFCFSDPDQHVHFLRKRETTINKTEPPRDKTNKMEYAPSEDSDQPGHPPSLISLRCPHDESLGPELPTERTDWADAQAYLSLRRVHIHLVGFVMRRLI